VKECSLSVITSSHEDNVKVLALPQLNFRGKKLSFEEFSDLTIIGMAGLTTDLIDVAVSPFVDGMVNYKRVADGLGLVYEPDWIDRFSSELESGVEAIASHDGGPDGKETTTIGYI